MLPTGDSVLDLSSRLAQIEAIRSPGNRPGCQGATRWTSNPWILQDSTAGESPCVRRVRARDKQTAVFRLSTAKPAP